MQRPSTISFCSPLLPLLMVILLDVAGIIIVLPVLTPLILQTDSGLISAQTNLFIRDFLYGLSLALFPMFMFFSTPILGDLSDRFGRKNILLICLLGSAFSYLVSAWGILIQQLSLLLLGRAIAGLAAGTQAIATAAIIDLSTPHTKTKYLAWVVFTTSIGIILGPALGGFTSEKSLIHWFGYHTPFLIAASVAVINAILLYFLYHENVHQTLPKKSIHLFKGFHLFISAFADKRFSLLSIFFFCFCLAWSLYYETINWFFMENFQYNTAKLGLFVAYIGVVYAIITTLFSRFIMQWFADEVTTIKWFILIMTVANLGAALTHSEVAQWLWVILNAAGEVICFTISLTLFSNSASSTAQGWVMGVTGALGAITWTVGGLLAGPLGYISLQLPFWTATLLCFISYLLIRCYTLSKPIRDEASS